MGGRGERRGADLEEVREEGQVEEGQEAGELVAGAGGGGGGARREEHGQQQVAEALGRVVGGERRRAAVGQLGRVGPFSTSTNNKNENKNKKKIKIRKLIIIKKSV